MRYRRSNRIESDLEYKYKNIIHAVRAVLRFAVFLCARGCDTSCFGMLYGAR
jgi:hypothetical protein